MLFTLKLLLSMQLNLSFGLVADRDLIHIVRRFIKSL